MSQRKPNTRKPTNTSASRGKRAVQKTREGLFSRAVASLESGTLCASDQQSVDKLVEKHPHPLHELENIPISELPTADKRITVDVVEAAVRSFKKGTASRGLRPHHLVKGCSSGYKDVLLRDLTKAVNLLAQGEVPLEFAPYVAGASLFALDKTKNEIFDVRPIASGEILRRLVSKCLCSTNKKDFSEFSQINIYTLT